VVFAGGQRVAASAVVVPMDVVVNFSAGSGALTATHFNNGAHGANWGTWVERHYGQEAPSLNDHTVIEDHDVALPFKLDCAGSLYDGSEGQGLTFDHSALPDEYDMFHLTLPGGKTGMLALILAKFEMSLGGTPTGYNNDTIIMGGANYTVPQFQFTFQGAMRWTCHSEDNLGATIPYSGGWVVIGVHHDAAGAHGEMYVQDATTGNVIGASRTDHDPVAGTLGYLRVQDYLRLANHGVGSIKIKLVAFRDTDLTFPPYTLPVPTPLALAHTRTGANQQTLTWTSPCQVFAIARNKNSGGWTTLDADYDNKPAARAYVDSDVTDGDTVQYRVTAKVGAQSSAIATSLIGTVA
jgi:hypothetical protein